MATMSNLSETNNTHRNIRHSLLQGNIHLKMSECFCISSSLLGTRATSVRLFTTGINYSAFTLITYGSSSICTLIRFLLPQNYDGGRKNLIIHSLICEENSMTGGRKKYDISRLNSLVYDLWKGSEIYVWYVCIRKDERGYWRVKQKATW